MRYKIEFLDSSKADLIQLKEYLSQFYPGTVKRFNNEFKKYIKVLAQNPCAFPACEYAPRFRRVVVGDYLVFYKVVEQTCAVKIHRIIRGTLNYSNSIKL